MLPASMVGIGVIRRRCSGEAMDCSRRGIGLMILRYIGQLHHKVYGVSSHPWLSKPSVEKALQHYNHRVLHGQPLLNSSSYTQALEEVS